jgi:pimeloyl-ACP methyl ester carboxylesterase
MRLAALFLACAVSCAQAQDYGREQRWAAEVVPSVVVGDAVKLTLSNGREYLGLYTDVPGASTAILLVHGMGVHPDHGVIGILRSALADAGFSTLSIQMPVLAADASAIGYQILFPEAAERIRAAGDWLQHKGARRFVLLSHSMGSRMSAAYYQATDNTLFSAWISMGITVEYSDLRNVRGPILDIYGEKDFPGVLASEASRRKAIEAVRYSKQVTIPGADHYFTGKEKELTAALVAFLGSLR